MKLEKDEVSSIISEMSSIKLLFEFITLFLGSASFFVGACSCSFGAFVFIRSRISILIGNDLNTK